jgi:signal transduction histidine kinase
VSRRGGDQPTAQLLLVDDRPENLLALAAALRPLGQTLVTANSGEEALRHLLTEEFAVILLDVQMPGMDGFETAAQIKQRERSRHIPIIFLTAISRELHQQLRGYEVGAVDYISKPYDPWVLRSKVSVFINLHQKTRLLEEQAAELAKANRELDEFAEMLSHDLRTPLVAVSGYLELIESLNGEGRDFAFRALEAARSMGSLIDDLLSYARAGKAVGALRSTDAGKALDQALRNCHVDLEQAGGTVTHGDLPVVAADGPQLVRLFQNLIGNAAKYRRGDHRFEARVEAARAGPEWVFSVIDNGVGLPAEGADDDLFAMFHRGAGAARQPGSGIGLAICKKIVEGHGGRIWAEPAEGGGAAFRFTIPADSH